MTEQIGAAGGWNIQLVSDPHPPSSCLPPALHLPSSCRWRALCCFQGKHPTSSCKELILAMAQSAVWQPWGWQQPPFASTPAGVFSGRSTHGFHHQHHSTTGSSRPYKDIWLSCFTNLVPAQTTKTQRRWVTALNTQFLFSYHFLCKVYFILQFIIILSMNLCVCCKNLTQSCGSCTELRNKAWINKQTTYSSS